ncbi:MAG: class I SAM-dependent methyltransferase [Candidatus Portnoybacteria bacterium]|nr:class I SAM-dependent methyltransferase [Patescibacteria group bacterium]MBU4453197.1 class I SAM-dependent methyltransferase [Patescibacteria group bacterium]MCG2687380.1 class I SAM-dependent methyltransferase [Candidatus Parcubacteria bacterium]
MNQWNKIYKDEGEAYGYYNILKPHEDIDKVIKLFTKHNVNDVLDLGCGAGRNLIYLAKKNFNLSGLDLAPEGLKLIKKDLSKNKIKADLAVGSIYNKFSYQDESFDAIISVQVLQHGTEKQILKAIDEIKRILKPGGLVFITLCGRLSNGRVRLFLVKTARQIAPNTYKPTKGNEQGLTHFIYNKTLIQKHFKDFKILNQWKDSKDYYCFVGQKR